MTKVLPCLSSIGLLLSGLLLTNTIQAQQTEAYQQHHPLYKRAMELWHHDHYGAAMQQFERYREVGDRRLLKAEAQLYKARCAMELFHKSTEQAFLKYIEQYPEIGNQNLAYFFLGKYFFRKKSFDKTVKYFSQINDGHLNEQRSDAHRFMEGYAYYKLNQMTPAKAHFAQLMDRQNPYRARANYYFGFINYQEGDYDTVLHRFKAIEGHQKFGRIVPVYITQIHLLQQQYAKAISYGRKNLQKETVGKKPLIRGYVGEAAYHRRAYDRVIESLEQLKTVDTLNPSQRYKLAFSYLKKGDFEKSAKTFEKLPIKEDSTGQHVAYHLGEALTQTGDKAKARNLFQFAAELDHTKQVKEKAAFRYAKLSFEAGYQKTAQSRLQAFIQNYPESQYVNEAQNLLGELLLNTKNYQRALSIIEKVPNLNRQMQKAYQQIAYKRGLELYQDQDYPNARELFIKALKNPIKPEFKALSYFWLGEAYYHIGSYDRAIRAFKNFLYQDAAKKTPHYALASYNIGYSHFKKSDYKNAIDHFKDYLDRAKAKPKSIRYTDALVRMADCHFAMTNYKPARAFYEKVIGRKHKSVPYALYQKGIIQGLQGQKDQKIETLRQLTQNHKQSQYVDDALFEIGNVYFIRSEYRLAYNQFRYLTQDYPNSSYYRLAFLKMALVRYNQNKPQAAIDQLKKIVRDFPYSEEAKEAIDQMKTIYIDMGRADSLFAFLKSVKSADLTASFQDSASYNSAFSYMKDQNCDQAIEAFREYLADFPQGYFAMNAHFYLAECARQKGLRQTAIKHYRTVVEKGATQFNNPSLSTLARLYQRQNNCQKAVRYLRKLQTNANERRHKLQALTGLMECQFSLTAYEESAKHARQLLALDFLNQSKQIKARYYLGKSYFQLGQYQKALPELTQVYQTNGGEMGAEALYLKAKIQYELEQFKNAQQTIYQLREDFTNYNYWVAKGFVLLGEVFVKLDNNFQAKATLQSVIDNYDGEELVAEAKEKLNRIKEKEKAAAKEKADSIPSRDPDTLNELKNE